MHVNKRRFPSLDNKINLILNPYYILAVHGYTENTRKDKFPNVIITELHSHSQLSLTG